ncbi:hypothetical protein QQF64_025248 [Cirrhinus molitorella]|uniref:Uncharacterized protein n=2 Tax=Cirrhinus molitorella TaxID=172907 RepID=A0AA88U797_9TELE|nr:hypothetical protein Q8A67_001050 [Cirrhinus molitorella]
MLFLTTSDWRSFGFCFLYFSLVAGTQAECPVQLSQKSVVVEYGDSVAVNCTATVQHDGMGWEADEGRVEKTSASVITWSVPNLREWEIQPFCYINYVKLPNTPPCQVQLPVTVYKTPDSVSISFVNHSGPMIEGKQYELQCDVQNVAPVQILSVIWYKGQTRLNQTTFTDTIKTPVNKTDTLLITADRADDGAQYGCEAKLDLGAEGPQPVNLKSLISTVHFKPIINETILPSIVTVFRGYQVELVCEAEGNPKPNISWSLGGVETVYNKVLTVSESTPEDVLCNASNSVDWTTKQVKVSIQVPDISISFVNHTGSVIVGKNYELQCIINNVAPFKNVSVRWYKQNQIIHTDTIKTPISNMPKLLIEPNRADDRAQYWCEAELEAEGPKNYPKMSSGHLNFTVQYISISFVNDTGSVIAGKNYELQCIINNVAPSKNVPVRWYKQNQIISNVTIKTPISNMPKLLIEPNRADDRAQYWCEAELEAEGPQNYIKISSEHLNITVQFKPIINETKLPSTVPVFRGYPEVLTCTAEGNPKPTISWIVGAKEIFTESLNISELTPENVYCNASNSVGSTTRQIEVVLKEDYLPLIAGLIAVTVAFISVIFVFIFSIYYKTAKMGRYSLKDAKPSAQNGNIAQNGKHNPIPMKKLSQSSILA